MKEFFVYSTAFVVCGAVTGGIIEAYYAMKRKRKARELLSEGYSPSEVSAIFGISMHKLTKMFPDK